MMQYEGIGARFAKREEIRKAGTEVILESQAQQGAGLPLFGDIRKVYVADDDTHSLIIGGSGSKKNRLLIFLTIYLLAKNGENIVINDPKGESLARTGHFLKEQGYKIRVIDMRHIAQRGDFWNPLMLGYEYYQKGERDKAGELFSDFIDAISADQRKTTNDAFWPSIASALATFLIRLAANTAEPDEMNVGTFARMCALDSMEEVEKLARILPDNSIEAINLKGVLAGAERTKMSVYITLFSMVSRFLNQENLTAALSDSSFDIKELATKKSALFIITPDEKSNYNFVISMMVKQLYQVLVAQAQEREDVKLERRVNFILDEFCNAPRIKDFRNMISAARSRNIRFFLVVQSLHQLIATYGESEAHNIIGNCNNIAFLHSRELPLLKMLSELCGARELSDGRMRALITEAEMQRLSKEKGEILYLVGRLHPFVSQLPDIDEFDIFKGYPVMQAPKSRPRPARIMSVKKLVEDVFTGARPIPFSEPEKEEIKSGYEIEKEMKEKHKNKF